MTNKSPRKKHAQPTKRKTRAKRKKTAPKKELSTLFIVVVAALLGLFIWSLFSLKQLPEREPQSASSKTSNNASDKLASDTVPVVEKSLPNDKKADNDYDFYELLKDFEVEVFDDDVYTSERTSDRDYLYIIQVASYKTAEQAQRTRAELLLLGLEPTISSARNDSGTLWYRVRLGPFPSRNAIPQRRSTLLSNGFEAQIMKRKKK